MSDSSDSPTPQLTAAATLTEASGSAHAAQDDDACEPSAASHARPHPVATTESPVLDGSAAEDLACASSVQLQGTVASAQAMPDDPCASCRKRRRACPKYPRQATDAAPHEQPLYTLGEEIANSITHGIGVLLAIAGLVLLIVKAALGGALPTHLASAIVFGVTLILEYLASTLYHAIQVPPAKRVFRTIDHSCIYLLIAGSYTPFCLVTLVNDGGIWLFVAVWALAFAGIAFEVIGRQRQPRWVTIIIYLVMGWLVVFRLPQLVAALDPVALALLAVGGLSYTIGCAFYAMKQVRYMHSVWHLWVLAGSIFQFMAVILYVI